MHPTKKSKLAKQSLTNYKNERQHSRGDSFQMADFKKAENIIEVENVSQQDSSDSNDVPFQLEEWKQQKRRGTTHKLDVESNLQNSRKRRVSHSPSPNLEEIYQNM